MPLKVGDKFKILYSIEIVSVYVQLLYTTLYKIYGWSNISIYRLQLSSPPYPWIPHVLFNILFMLRNVHLKHITKIIITGYQGSNFGKSSAIKIVFSLLDDSHDLFLVPVFLCTENLDELFVFLTNLCVCVRACVHACAQCIYIYIHTCICVFGCAHLCVCLKVCFVAF